MTINNLEGPAGDYALKMTATGAGGFATPVDRKIHLDAGANFSDGFMLAGTTAGNAAIHLDLAGPKELHIVRDFTVGVRPAQAYQLRRFVGRLLPGESVTLDDGANSLFHEGGTALIIHAKPDDLMSDPSGNSGDRVACGVIQK